MSKKLFAACLVIAAFAVVPSLASANPVLTHPTGKVLAAPVKILATNVGETELVTSTGTLKCTTAHLTGTLISNSTAGGAKGEITAATFGGTGGTAAGEPQPECTGTNFFTPNTSITPETTLPWCLETAAATDTFTVKGGQCGSQVPIKFRLAVTGVGTCEYERATTVNGTLVTHGGGTNENTGAITNQSWGLIAGPGLCPSTGALTMRFELETDEAPFEKIYISS
jgi:hypothetical protein